MASTTVAPVRQRSRFAELLAYRRLIYNLTLRDIRLKYKGSFLGVAWSFLNPLLQMAIYTVIFSLFLRVVLVPHAWVFLIGGILFWTFFSTSLVGASSSLVRNPNLISKVYFPIEALPISMVLANFVNFLIPLAVLTIVLPFSGAPVGLSMILTPVIVAAMLALTLGLSLLAATLTVFLRDIEHFLLLGTQIFFYATPILYPLNLQYLPQGADRFLTILRLNPLAWYLDSYHNVLYFGVWPNPKEFIAMLVFSTLSLVVGYWAFSHFRPSIPENV